MGFSLKKLGRAIDPTSKSSPLGGLVRKGLDAGASMFGVPPGVVSGGLETMGSKSGSKPGAPPAATAPPGSTGAPSKPFAVRFREIMTKPAVIIGGLVAVALLVGVLVFKRK